VIASIVIPSRDGARFLPRCLAAVERSRLPPGWDLEALVVDSGSSDGSAALVEAFPRARALVHRAPLGFAAANNAARPFARGEVIAFLNNDTEPEPDWLLRPLEILSRDPSVVAVGPKLVFQHRFAEVRLALPDGGRAFVGSEIFGGPLDRKVRWDRAVAGESLLGDLRGRWVADGARAYLPIPIPGVDPPPPRPPAIRLLGQDGPRGPVRLTAGPQSLELPAAPAIAVLWRWAEEPGVALVQNAGTFLERGEAGDAGAGELDGNGRWDREELVPALCGAALVARRAALDRVGWFPRYYTMYYEDTDLSLRLGRLGRLVYCPAAVVRHYHTGTSREGSPEFVEHVARSTILFAVRHASPRVLARVAARRARDLVLEWRSALRHGPLVAWRHARRTAGTIRALPAVGPVALERLVDRTPVAPPSPGRVPYLLAQAPGSVSREPPLRKDG
jgi:GT2 family glycosyltransferase